MRWLLVLLVGCYAPTPPDGIPCTDDMVCPSGLECRFDRCYAEPPPCIEIDAGAGRIMVPRIESEIVLDGQLDDWPTCFIIVDQGTAGLIRDLGANGQFAPGRFSLAASATDDRVFVAAEVQSVFPLGDHAPPDVYLNNAISAYFDADGSTPTNRYDTDAMQIVVDHANRSAGFRSGTGVVPVSAMESATSVSDSTFTIEMSVRPPTFGTAMFSNTVGFDIGLVGGNGDVMTSELVWFQACTRPQCGCANGNESAPFCDARQFGRATIAPP